MTRMTGLDCAVMCNLINTHTQTTHTHILASLPLSCICNAPLPEGVQARGTTYEGMMHVTDWTPTLASVTGIPTVRWLRPRRNPWLV